MPLRIYVTCKRPLNYNCENKQVTSLTRVGKYVTNLPMGSVIPEIHSALLYFVPIVTTGKTLVQCPEAGKL